MIQPFVQSLMGDSIQNVGDSLKVVLEYSRAPDIRTATLIVTCVFGPSLFQREGQLVFWGLSVKLFLLQTCATNFFCCRRVRLTFLDFDLEPPSFNPRNNKTSCYYDYIMVSGFSKPYSYFYHQMDNIISNSLLFVTCYVTLMASVVDMSSMIPVASNDKWLAPHSLLLTMTCMIPCIASISGCNTTH